MSTKTQSGISLVELIVFIVIVSVGITGILSVMNFTSQHSADPMVQKQALAVAESMLEEVELKAFTAAADGFAGPYTQTNRPQFDAIENYAGFTTAGILPADGTTTPIAGLENYNLTVTITTSAGADLGIPAVNATRIVVTVTDPNGQTTTLTGYRTG